METILDGLQNLAEMLNGISPFIPITLALLLGSVAASGTWRRSLIYTLFGSAALILAAQWTVPITASLSQSPVSEHVGLYPRVYMLILILSFVALLGLYQLIWRPKAQPLKNNFWFFKFIASGLIGWMLGVMIATCIQIAANGRIASESDFYQTSVLQSSKQVALLTEEFVPWQTPSFFCDLENTLCIVR